jgi:GNAT superfamily N-acetyltransferase
MRPDEIEPVVTLIRRAMNPDEAQWADETLHRHFQLQGIGVHDGRHYFSTCRSRHLAAITGLHHYEWGPPENVWLGWFAVAPEFQGSGLGTALFNLIQNRAYEMGFRKMFIETYSSPTFNRARRFYARQGFIEAGRISDYLSDHADMVVFSKILGRS